MRASAFDVVRVLRAALETAALRRLQFAWALTSLAYWSSAIVLAVYGFSVGGATAVGLIGLARMLPAAFTAPITGLIGDRHSRRDVLLVCALLRCGLGLLVAACVLAGVPLAVAVAIASLQTIAGMAYKPAQAAFLPQLARTPEQMAAANAVWSAIESLGFLVGAIAGGLLIAGLAPETALAATALPYALAALLLAGIPRDATPEHRRAIEGSSVRDEALLGFRTVLGDRELRTLVGTLSASTLVEGAVDTLLVVVAIDLLDLGDAGVGLLNAMWAAGGIAGGVVALGLLGRGRLARGLAIGCLCIGLPLVALAVWPVTGVALAGLLVLGAGYTLVETAGLTLMQRLASDEVLSRVFGVVESTYVASTGIGAVLAPLLLALLGTRATLAVVGAALPVLAIARRRTLARFEAGHQIPARPFALLRGVPLFAPLPVASVENLALRMEPVPVTRGDAVVNQGQTGERFFVIDRGRMEVLVNGEHIRIEGPGEFFGEIALLHAVPRTATVRALEDGLLLALDRDEFVATVTGNPRSLRAADGVIGERIAEAAP